MKAYAILSGGGVKGTALAGCVNAAHQAGIEFVGYGGTSAGSIVSLLASIGYKDEELKRIAIDEMPFHQFLDDKGEDLGEVKSQVDVLLREGSVWKPFLTMRKISILWSLGRYAKTLGLYKGDLIERFLRKQIVDKIPALSDRTEITFRNLEENGGKQLKVVATDLRRRAPAVFEQDSKWGSSVLQAVRASTAYPFVFRPVEIEDTRLVDGGLASNVPVFLFREEQNLTRYPVFAFDVGAANKRPLNNNGLSEFVRDLLTAALEASDSTLRRSLPGIEYIKVDLPEQLDALDFNVDSPKREALYWAGHGQTDAFLRKYPPLELFHRAHDVKQKLQSRYGPPTLYQPILAAVAKECEDVSGVADVRATIMLPTMHHDGTRIVVYDYNMEGDADQALVLREYAGCSGAALKEPEGVMVADVEESLRNPEPWHMSADEALRIPLERKSIMSVVIPSWHDVAELVDSEKLKRSHRIGVLSVDTTTPLLASRWEEPAMRTELARRLFNWAKIIARLLAV